MPLELETAKAKFWSRVEIPLGKYWRNRCWIWQGALTKHNPHWPGKMGGDNGGYGMLRADGKVWRAHLYALHLCGIKIPKGKIGRHTCDQRACVNPTHVVPGTLSENMQDVYARGRR